MAELAEVEDAATEAAFNAACPGDQVPPPVAKAPQVVQEPVAAPIHVDDTPTKPATSPSTPIQKSENGQSSFSFRLESMVLAQNQISIQLDTS